MINKPRHLKPKGKLNLNNYKMEASKDLVTSYNNDLYQGDPALKDPRSVEDKSIKFLYDFTT